jgi:Zn-dependent protease with chaperone function
VLAHEYGHFRHRDTAGGDVALRVNSDMIRFANAMIRSGQATWWNIAFHFLRLYHFIFRRITHGATRLQEVLADRIAVRLFGAKAFEEGLSHAIRRDVEFSHLATAEIRRAVDTKQAMQNLYELSEIKTETEKTIAAKVHAAINRETTEDDTHPSPADRFRLASRITSEGETPASGTVWEFFTDRQALTAEMSAVIDKQLGRVVLRK